MKIKKTKEFQTVSLFIILAFLTMIFVLALRVVLNAPILDGQPVHIPEAQEAIKTP